jgi:L-fuculose-phosphate aldolase
MSVNIATDSAIAEMRAKVAQFGRMLYERKLFDAAGGNITARVGDLICMSPRYAGSKHQWQLTPDDVLVVDSDRNIVEGNGQISRETKCHFTLHENFGEHGTAVIHAHSRNLLVFAALKRPIPPVLEATQKFGEIPVVEYAPAHTQNLADNIANAIRGNEARIEKQAAAAIAPWHGLFVMGKDLDAAFDAVERIDNNAYIILMAQTLGLGDALDEKQQELVDAMANFKE